MAAQDKFANRFCVTVGETIAGTIKYVEVPTYVEAFSHRAFLLHRLEYHVPPGDLDMIIGATDSICMALTSVNNIGSISGAIAPEDPGLIDLVQFQECLRGAAASFSFNNMPLMHDFTSLPGGGILVPARPIYGAIQGVSLAAACKGYIRGWFTQVELKADEYLELVDAYRIIR
jgi:hypothetical protein